VRAVNEDEVRRITLNPFYATEIAPMLAEPHDPMATEEQWIAANTKLIEEMGTEAWLREFLAVLKGDFIAAPPQGPTGSPPGRRTPPPVMARGPPRSRSVLQPEGDRSAAPCPVSAKPSPAHALAAIRAAVARRAWLAPEARRSTTRAPRSAAASVAVPLKLAEREVPRPRARLMTA
jgi:hypothetical protein